MYNKLFFLQVIFLLKNPCSILGESQVFAAHKHLNLLIKYDKVFIGDYRISTNKPYITAKDAIGDLPNLKSGKYELEPFCDYQKMMRKNVKMNGLKNHKAPNHPVDVIRKIESTIPGKPMYPKLKQRIRLAWDIQNPTQVSGGIRPQFQFGHPSNSRDLTIRERCRLQSFPDDFVLFGGIVQGRVQTGNAVPPLLTKTIALAITRIER